MSGIYKGSVMKGIGQGINTAMSGILNLYGLQQKLDLQKQTLAIDKQNADNYSKMLHYSLASKF